MTILYSFADELEPSGCPLNQVLGDARYIGQRVAEKGRYRLDLLLLERPFKDPNHNTHNDADSIRACGIATQLFLPGRLKGVRSASFTRVKSSSQDMLIGSFALGKERE
eukprot:TRINITY_DN11231_c0_g1_i5.p4 TRINITY_DN11231_c0_g1~~TRINITY_DN11231_c0_g1_i5.p4  ORF type:complete len:109 (-),score=6.78 TRINITY_DN11231_c0_g1_i5:931-1257(-)